MSRLRSVLHAQARRRRKALGLFVTNGFPSLDATVPLLHALEAGGADFIELGMPFSDPLGEGRPIQRSSARALSGGACMEDTFRTAATFRGESEVPLLLMGYINPILQYGIGNFCAAASSSGVDGLIIPDLPVEEAGLMLEEAGRQQLDTIFLIAPNTPESRIREIDRLSTGFVYAVSVTGLTGVPLADCMSAVTDYLTRIRKVVTHNPLLVGFGIKTPADAAQLCRHTDGCIVGSALVRLVEDLWSNGNLSIEQRLGVVRQFASSLASGIEQ